MSKTERAVFKVFIKGSIDAVWREITKLDDLQPAFFNMRMQTNGLKPGGQIRMQSANAKYTGSVGEILEFDPPRRFSHTFRFTQYEDPPCRVTYDLKQVEGGVDFTMTCDDIPSNTKTAKQMKQGGNMITRVLKSVVETGKPSIGMRLMFALFKLSEPFSPKKTLSENWPLDTSVAADGRSTNKEA